MDVIGLIKAAFQAVTAYFNRGKQESELANTEAMRQAEEARLAQLTKDKINKAIQSKDENKTRDLLS